MNTGIGNLYNAAVSWLIADSNIHSAVLFGSSARMPSGVLSDIDLHLVAADPLRLFHVDWNRALQTQQFLFSARQPATGGTHKVTILFDSGQIDLIIVSRAQMRLARLAMALRLYRKIRYVENALNEMATSMRMGYRFIKGERVWGELYSRVVKELPGIRLDDSAVRQLAEAFLVNLVLALTRLRCGELIAAQHWIHHHLIETNLRFIRELQLRRGSALRSFGLGRHAESSLLPVQLEWIQVSAPLKRDDLCVALVSAFKGMKALTAELAPSWQVPAAVEKLVTARMAEFENSSAPLTPAR